MKAFRFITHLAARWSPTDEQLMWRVHAGDDHAAFGELVERWRERIHALCTRMVGDSALGEDLVQVTFARVYEKRGDYRPSARFSTYLWRVAVNLCHDELRRTRTRAWFGSGAVGVSEEGIEGLAADPLEVLPAGDLAPSAAAADREEGELVRAAVLGLPEPYRTVLVLRHYQDLKLREIAEILEVPEGTVNSRLAEALTRLARVLKPQLQPGPLSPGPTPSADVRWLNSNHPLTPAP